MSLVNCPELRLGLVDLIADRTRGLLLDASGEKAAFCVAAPKSGNITKVHFYTRTVTTGDTLKVSLQDTSLTTGNPDETIDQSGTVVIADTDDNVIKSVTLDTARTVTQGDYLSVVIEFNSYVAGNLEIMANEYGGLPRDSYSNLKTGGSWAKQGRGPIVLLEYSDGSFPNVAGAVPGMMSQYANLDSGDTPDEIALRFKLPAPMRLSRVTWMGDMAAGSLPNLVLYEGTTALATISLDGDVSYSTVAALFGTKKFPTPYQCAKDTVYRLALKPTTTTTVGLHYIDVATNAHLESTPGGKEFYTSERTDGGSWSDVTTRLPAIDLIFDQIDDGTGGGGGGRPNLLRRLQALSGASLNA